MNLIGEAMNIQLFEAHNQVMTLKEITDLLEVRHDNAMNVVAKMLENQDFGTAPKIKEQYAKGNGAIGETETYQLNKRQSIAVAAKLNTSLLMRIIDRWQELESANKPQLPTNYIDALKALVVSEEQKQLALIERDHAIRTKAEIGSRREATAMSTAAVATKKANRLEIELDKSKEYATIKRMEMLCHGQKFNWRLLKSACQDLGIEPIDVFDANYGTVKSYPEAAWIEAYALTINNI